MFEVSVVNVQLHCGCVVEMGGKVEFSNCYDFYRNSKLCVNVGYFNAVCRKHEKELYTAEQYVLYGKVALKLHNRIVKCNGARELGVLLASDEHLTTLSLCIAPLKASQK
eukprot:TRINITY_DN6284_c0_g2_i3.p2 TRINITY_DN6284_c0_g2~~TRINITY_DN6284_c0_g2_i3.p2  ORF type:complete len:119 (-),score=8.08 TRINITY_DN6284_c0_g2_i3:881-1210(-)